MNCRDAIALLGDQREGDLAPRSGWRLRLHFWCCRYCRNYRRSYNATVELGQRALSQGPEPTVPEDLVKDILEALASVAP